MIVMKLGGSSLESPEAIRRACGIIHSHLQRRPIVVVSALGKTTDHLIDLAGEASLGRGYAARKLLNEIQDLHFGLAAELIAPARRENVEQRFRKAFRELFGLIHDLSEDGRILTAEVLDTIASYGERLSSELVAAALPEAGVPAVHLEARELIVTDEHFGAAVPFYWETYARVRREIAQMPDNCVAVLGGFIGATEDGRTTTLGRGGSDLTASLAGAAVCADEIQIWTDVDGMLTCDPRVYGGVHRLRQISYAEAATMAAAGAKVLHPDTMQPAIRQQIPLVIRNSHRPHCEGTRIVPAAAPAVSLVKSIAVIQNLLLLAIRPPVKQNTAGTPDTVKDYLQRRTVGAVFIKRTADLIYAAFPNTSPVKKIEMDLDGCVEGRVLMNYSVITLVGTGVERDRTIVSRIEAALKGMELIEFHSGEASNGVSFALPQRQSRRACELLHREFFSTLDESLFAPAISEPVLTETPSAPLVNPLVSYAIRKTRILARLSLGGHLNGAH